MECVIGGETMKVFKDYIKTLILFVLIILLFAFTVKFGLDLINNDYESAKKVFSFLGIERYRYMFFYYSLFSLSIYTILLIKYSDNVTVRIMLPFYQALLWGIYLRSDYDFLSIYKQSTRDFYREIGYTVNPIIYRTNITLFLMMFISIILFQIKNPLLKKIIHIGIIAVSIYMLVHFKWRLTSIYYDH